MSYHCLWEHNSCFISLVWYWFQTTTPMLLIASKSCEATSNTDKEGINSWKKWNVKCFLGPGSNVIFQFHRSKGHGSGCTTTLSRMHHYLHCLYCWTPPTSLYSDNTQTPPQINNGTDPKTGPASKIKSQCACNTPYT